MISTRRLTPALGAEVTDLDVSQQLSDPVVEEIYGSLIENHVLIFRDADMKPVDMAALGSGLGTLGIRHHLYVNHPESPDVNIIEWQGDDKPDAAEWHSDMTYRAQPPFASILKAVVVPPSGGDTLWASMFAVHDALPPGMLSDLEGLKAVHDMGTFRNPAYESGGVDGIEKAMIDAGTAVHPIIETHPVSGRRYVNVSESFTRWIIGMAAPESTRVLNYIFDLVKSPEFQIRLKWEPNTIAIWDNRGTQHYAVVDYLPDRRVMHRVAVVADTRVSQPG